MKIKENTFLTCVFQGRFTLPSVDDKLAAGGGKTINFNNLGTHTRVGST